jgi:hypothetical protein
MGPAVGHTGELLCLPWWRAVATALGGGDGRGFWGWNWRCFGEMLSGSGPRQMMLSVSMGALWLWR